ncbi:hypothetical protein ONS95_002024 [Cadophora gregata]|uniref:uncharacterized protein n=1 Tax=Cadophora gregata TaxID=51156 RepID=UPI0026DC238C|nr:uncharacterized protein ONS95_002024 [Cadophora gregata]KAK0111679.1 hypothetical protein ONS95_002024 [Cadophora gregata]KAK0111844.1 hypothetical protein ONS96_001112 [Cadophora gregata f. sp. sojae]
MLHQLFRVRLNGSNEHFALDLSSAQYGYYDPVVPFDTYATDRSSALLDEHDQLLGQARSDMGKQGTSGRLQRSTVISKSMILDCIMKAITLHRIDANTTVGEMLKAGEIERDRWSADLLHRSILRWKIKL